MQEIRRQRPKLIPDSSDYDPDIENGKGKEGEEKTRLNLSISPTWAMDLPFVPIIAEKMKGLLGGGVKLFDQITLHEVGHAVDDKKTFMKNQPEFGGWESHSVEVVLAKVAEFHRFYDDFKDRGDLPRPFLTGYLLAVLNHEKPKESIVGGPDPKDKVWKELANHPAVKCAEHIRKSKGEDGLWDKDDGEIAKYALGKRVYQESYDKDWTSYNIDARGIKLSKYQFRAAGEWYAEAYSAFFLGKLPEGHPLYDYLKADQDAEKKA
jgi:hypothetical protein